jgi:c-di-GMP-binding flagellar brake protein YcgR
MHPRKSCKGTARILVLPDGPHVTGNLLNLSLGGCCIEFDKAIKAAANAQLDVLLDACDLRVRIPAEIRRRNDNQIGIKFLEVSARKSEQIQLLIKELFEFGKIRGYSDDDETGE